MFEVLENRGFVKRVYLVGIRWKGAPLSETQDHLDELAQLTDTMGVPVVGSEIVPLDRANPAFLIGSGKTEEIAAECARLEVDCLIFDDDLSPTQQRNWEKRLENVCVIDRQEVILDIFAQRARTREARLQVGLARLEYSLPRLRRAWTHLERQRGGGGFRGGAGELQLETDQRVVRNQIVALRRELAEVRKRRAVQRKQRRVKSTPTAAIVGYTNAGKSSLLHALTGANVRIEDKLFATLDPTTRRILLPNNQELLLSDTVGFIRKLPHDLIEAFKATLEEAQLADMLIHVVDVSHPRARDQIEATHAVLKELNAFDKPMAVALNKMDRLEDRSRALEFFDVCERVVPISATTGEGLDQLLAVLAEMRSAEMLTLVIEAPPGRYDIVSLLHREGYVRFEAHTPEGAWLKVEFPRRHRRLLDGFIRDALPEELLAAAPRE